VQGFPSDHSAVRQGEPGVMNMNEGAETRSHAVSPVFHDRLGAGGGTAAAPPRVFPRRAALSAARAGTGRRRKDAGRPGRARIAEVSP